MTAVRWQPRPRRPRPPLIGQVRDVGLALAFVFLAAALTRALGLQP